MTFDPTDPRAEALLKRMDVPSSIDFCQPAQAWAWTQATIASRPWRPNFFEAFATALNRSINAPMKIAELGSGPGHLAAVLMRQCQVESYCAIDTSLAMHDLARDHLGVDATRVDFLTRDFRKPDWTDGVIPLDVVVSLQSVHELRHKARVPALFAQIFDALRPGGLFLYCDHYFAGGDAQRAALYMTPDQQVEALDCCDFDQVTLLLDAGGMALYSARRP